MTKKSFILLITGCLITLSIPAMAANSSLLIDSSQVVDLTQNLNTSGLKPASLTPQGSFQIASVCFLGVGDCGSDGGFNKGDDDMSIDTSKQCLNEGFVRNNCNSVQEADGICPYNSSYIKGCKCRSGLITCPDGQVGSGDSCGGKYATCQCDPNLIACPSNKNGSGVSCGGKYQSCVCKPEYQYNSSNCTSPRSVSGANCDGKYTGCICPTGVSTGAYGCKEYYPSPCGSVCKVAYTDNCHIRTAVSTPYGCMSYFSDCPSKCERAYTDNCRNRTAVTATYGCQTYFSDCASKCQTAYADNCRNRTAVSTPYGCSQYFADCTSKCQTAYADNCHNRTAVAAPYGCQQTWGDCGSKCQIAYGDNCHNRTAAATPYGCQANWADCSSKCQTAYADNCRNRTAVSVPANGYCSAYFSDCSSKCSAWTCNSGYTKSGESCIEDKPKTCEDYGYYTSKKVPALTWSCSTISTNGLSCWKCTRKDLPELEPTCPTDSATWCRQQGYGHVYCKNNQTYDYCSCNSGYWKCVDVPQDCGSAAHWDTKSNCCIPNSCGVGICACIYTK